MNITKHIYVLLIIVFNQLIMVKIVDNYTLTDYLGKG